tara:strand:+ start:6805 stop:8028 length:1224 start_codon:yes stop_codon:yes gene_type:complete
MATNIKEFILNIKSNEILTYATAFFLCSFLFGIFLNTVGLTVFIAFSIYVYSNSKSFLRFNNKLFWIIMSYGFFQITLIFAFSNHIKNSFSELLAFLPFLLIVISFFLNNKKLTSSLFPKLEFAFIISCLISAIVNLCNGIYEGVYLSENVNYYFLSYDYLGAVFGIQAYYLSLFYLIGSLFIIKHIKIIKYSYLCLLVLLISIFFLASRMTIFLTFIIIPIYLYKTVTNKKRLYTFVLIGLIFFISALLINPILSERISTVNSKSTNYSGMDLRSKIWENSYEVFKESPLIGHGIHNTNKKLNEQYKRKRFRAAIRNNYHSHNQFIQTSLDSGILGLLLLLAIIANTAYNLFQNRKITYLLAFACIVGTMLTESIFHRQWGLFLFAFFVGISFIKPLNANYINQIR